MLEYLRMWIHPGALAAVSISLCPTPALAWGDLGHEVIATIADHYLEPGVRSKLTTLLAADKSKLTPGTDLAAEATWADKYRDSDRETTHFRYDQTRNWHFVDLEIDGANLQNACFGQPPLQPGKLASRGPAADCVVDKIDEFVAELKSSSTSKKERLVALQFVLHFVGDLHQPLHSSDDHDEGGNEKFVTAPGVASGRLHGAWDTAFVLRLGGNTAQIASELTSAITVSQRMSWASGTPSEWAMESLTVAKVHAYGMLPAPSSAHHYNLSATYVADATKVTGEQLSKAGVRLAFLLNQALR